MELALIAICHPWYAGPVEITSAELSHAGRYSCTAKNAAGSTHRHVMLIVQGKNILRNNNSRHCCLTSQKYCFTAIHGFSLMLMVLFTVFSIFYIQKEKIFND